VFVDATQVSGRSHLEQSPTRVFVGRIKGSTIWKMNAQIHL
jgi:hypothetical protein